MNSNEIVVAESRNGLVGKVLMGAALVAALGGLWYQSAQTADVRKELAKTQQSMTQMKGEVDTTLATAKQDAEQRIAAVNEKLAAETTAAQKAAQIQVARVQAAARNQTGQAIKALNTKNEELISQIESIKQETASKSTVVDESLSSIKGDVGAVRDDVAAAKTELDKTIADLRRVNGDMGVMSGLIATNSTELEALKKLGERDYFEFTLAKSSNDPQTVGGIQLALKKADVKRNRFTMDVIADDHRIEKKDKNLNEPVQFYTSQARTPFELVVNQISKDQVKGYISVPKVKMIARN
jgi:chromosome segregation ATPase